MTPQKAFGDLSPYTALTGSQPRQPLTTLLEDHHGEAVDT